ncbi:MAG: RloB domain-containing protein [Halanaerobiales bacterium]|nr:RloB domain-containing protein [Halanaerobiales bacterium]
MAGQNNILAVTNPCFELWLLLHLENSFNEIVQCNQEEILLLLVISKIKKNIKKILEYNYILVSFCFFEI